MRPFAYQKRRQALTIDLIYLDNLSNFVLSTFWLVAIELIKSSIFADFQNWTKSRWNLIALTYISGNNSIQEIISFFNWNVQFSAINLLSHTHHCQYIFKRHLLLFSQFSLFYSILFAKSNKISFLLIF